MKLKKFIAMMAVTAMVAGMATGCGESKSDAGSDSTEQLQQLVLQH